MFIFIDESGSFMIPPTGGRNLCCVGALVVPERRQDKLLNGYDELRKKWSGYPEEVKGSALDEDKVASVIDLLVQNQCLFFTCATEMSLNSPAFMKEYQEKQAKCITENISDSCHPQLREQVFRLRGVFEQMPSQLFIQTVLLTDLIKKVIDQTAIQFAMKDPPEIGAFRWVIDGKDEQKTTYEAAWELMAAGLIQDRCIDYPSIAVAEGDYSFFQKNFSVPDNKWPAHLPKPRTRNPGERGMIWNLKKVLYESMMFATSSDCGGLQLADVITNAFRRALMGRLQRPAYDRMGELMRRLNGGPIEVYFFNSENDKERATFDEYNKPVAVIASRAPLVGM